MELKSEDDNREEEKNDDEKIVGMKSDDGKN